MRLWRRASGALKDQNSIWIASLSRKTTLRHPEIEATIVKATTHLETSLDRPIVERACEYIQRSPKSHLKPFMWSLSNRMNKTKNWVVALKGLHLMHVVLNSNIPGVNTIGRLPFNLSNFKDTHSSFAKTWCFNVFVRAYYAFLDLKSVVLYDYMEAMEVEKERGYGVVTLIRHEISIIHKLQALIDLLTQIRPQLHAAYASLVLDIMEDIMIDVISVYNRMCGGIVIAIDGILDSAPGVKREAMVALSAVNKATFQSEQISMLFEYCQRIGVHFFSPDVSFTDRVPAIKIKELEHLVYGVSERSNTEERKLQSEEKVVAVRDARQEKIDNELKDNIILGTIITDEWEKFDEDNFAPMNPFGSPFVAYVCGKSS